MPLLVVYNILKDFATGVETSKGQPCFGSERKAWSNNLSKFEFVCVSRASKRGGLGSTACGKFLKQSFQDYCGVQ